MGSADNFRERSALPISHSPLAAAHSRRQLTACPQSVMKTLLTPAMEASKQSGNCLRRRFRKAAIGERGMGRAGFPMLCHACLYLSMCLLFLQNVFKPISNISN